MVIPKRVFETRPTYLLDWVAKWQQANLVLAVIRIITAKFNRIKFNRILGQYGRFLASSINAVNSTDVCIVLLRARLTKGVAPNAGNCFRYRLDLGAPASDSFLRVKFPASLSSDRWLLITSRGSRRPHFHCHPH